MLAGILASFVVVAQLTNPAFADERRLTEAQDLRFIETSASSLRIFARVRGLDADKPSREFIGFLSEAAGEGASVQFFSRWNQYDAWIDGFDCKNSARAIDCLKVSSQPRCFYAPDTGRFSIADAISAIDLSLAMLPSSGPTLRALKFWQSGHALYGRVLTTEHEAGSQGTRFLCAKLEAGLKCMIFDQTENEP